jgi:hypothetical protein
MIIVFANEHDEHAKCIVQRWAHRGAALMLPSDLSRAGWSCTSRDPNHSTCVIGGLRRQSPDIHGVLVRCPAVLPSDLPHIATTDRSYVASEMTAFLVYWLTALGRPVMNRPTPRSLCGPGWYPEHWMHYAARAGLRVKARERTVSLTSIEHPSWPEHNGTCVDLTIVGQVCFGVVSPELARKGCALAAAAKVDLVKLRFDSAAADACFLEADLCPRIDEGCVEEAVLSHFEAARTAIPCHG